MYPVVTFMSTVVKTGLLTLIPKIATDVYNYAFADAPEQVLTKAPRKAADTTKITQHMYDYIHITYAEWRDEHTFLNPLTNAECRTQEDLTAYLNHQLNLNKSKSVYMRIIHGYVSRVDLPTGEPVIERG